MSRTGWRPILRWSSVKTGLPRVVILGRPNVGKSTLFNRLSRSRRAITDPTPGVTRDPVEIECTLAGHKVLLVDTGGLSLDREDLAKKVSDKSLDELSGADVALLVLDATKETG
ncbi:MAG: GTP-binding protein, partial [Spirochaetaceae bacterium]